MNEVRSQKRANTVRPRPILDASSRAVDPRLANVRHAEALPQNAEVFGTSRSSSYAKLKLSNETAVACLNTREK